MDRDSKHLFLIAAAGTVLPLLLTLLISKHSGLPLQDAVGLVMPCFYAGMAYLAGICWWWQWRKRGFRN